MPDAVDVLGFCMQEMAGFSNHLVATIQQFQLTGNLPESMFGQAAGAINGAAKSAKLTAKQARAARAGEKKPRQLTAFNWYVKAQIADLKATGITPEKSDDGKTVNLMTMAGARWKQLGVEGQTEFANKFKALQAEGSIPQSGDNRISAGLAAAASKKRRAEGEAGSAAQDAEAAGPSTGVAPTQAAGQSASKAKSVAGAAASPLAAPATQDGTQEGHKKKKKKHKSVSEVHASPESALKQAVDDGTKSAEKKKKKKHKHRESEGAAV